MNKTYAEEQTNIKKAKTCKFIEGDKCSAYKGALLSLFSNKKCVMLDGKDCSYFDAKITIQGCVKYANEEYYFNNFDENLIDELYTYFMSYDFVPMVSLIDDTEDDMVYQMKIDEKTYVINNDGMTEKI